MVIPVGRRVDKNGAFKSSFLGHDDFLSIAAAAAVGNSSMKKSFKLRKLKVEEVVLL